MLKRQVNLRWMEVNLDGFLEMRFVLWEVVQTQHMKTGDYKAPSLGLVYS